MENSENISNDGVVYCAVNRFDFQRKVYFISEPLHLIKTVRNNIENSHGHNNTRNLMVNGESISWQHIISVCEWDLGMHIHAFGLTKLPKLTEDHVSLSPRLRMRVNLAAQWLEETFLGYINQWETEVRNFEDVPVEIKSRYCLSYQTLEVLRTTVHAFVDLTNLLLHEYREVYLLSEKFNQDPLEENFGRHHARGVENPNVEADMHNEKKIILAKSEMLNIVRKIKSEKLKSI